MLLDFALISRRSCIAFKEMRMFCSIKHKKINVIRRGQIKLRLMTHAYGLLMVEWQKDLLSKMNFGALQMPNNRYTLYTQGVVKAV